MHVQGVEGGAVESNGEHRQDVGDREKVSFLRTFSREERCAMVRSRCEVRGWKWRGLGSGE